MKDFHSRDKRCQNHRVCKHLPSQTALQALKKVNYFMWNTTFLYQQQHLTFAPFMLNIEHACTRHRFLLHYICSFSVPFTNRAQSFSLLHQARSWKKREEKWPRARVHVSRSHFLFRCVFVSFPTN